MPPHSGLCRKRQDGRKGSFRRKIPRTNRLSRWLVSYHSSGFSIWGYPKLVGQSLSALGTSSLENFATVRGLHSLSEAMLLLSLTLLRLVSSEHFGYLLQDLLSGRNSAGLTGAEIPCKNTERTTLTVILYPHCSDLSRAFFEFFQKTAFESKFCTNSPYAVSVSAPLSSLLTRGVPSS